MKKLILKISIIAFLLVASISPAWAQPPLPPTHGESGDAQPSEGAPIGDGMFLLLAFSAAYSARKVYAARQEEDKS